MQLRGEHDAFDLAILSDIVCELSDADSRADKLIRGEFLQSEASNSLVHSLSTGTEEVLNWCRRGAQLS